MIDLYPLDSVEIVFGGFSIVDSILKTCTAAKTQFTQFNPSADTSSHHLRLSEIKTKLITDICRWRQRRRQRKTFQVMGIFYILTPV